jgi:Holliday junction resolvase-like predicted endonuclease
MIKTEIVPLKEQPVSDNVIRTTTGDTENGYFASSPPETSDIRAKPTYSANDKLKDEEVRFLKDIIEYPFMGVAKRYKTLLLSVRKGTKLKESMLAKGIIDIEEINTGKASLSLLKPTEAGIILARKHGIEQKKLDYRASLEHEYWRHKAAGFCKALGYHVEYEVPVNGKADIIARKGDISIAIEVETGKNNLSDAIENIKKNLKKDFMKVILISSDNAFLERVRLKMKSENLDSDKRVNNLPAHQFCAGKKK